MIVQKDFLNRLRDFGLNSYEAKLWAALLSRGISTAGELSDIANVPRSRSYDVLESLEKKGFIIIKIGKPIKYIAVPPEEVLERVKKKIKREAEKEANVLDEFKDSELLDELNSLHENGIDMVDPVDLSGALKGRNNLYAHLESMVRNADKSILLATTSKGFTRKLNEFKDELIKAKDRGVSIKIAVPEDCDNKTFFEETKDFAEIRKSDFKGRFMVIDNKELAFMMMHDEEVHPSYDVGVWVKTDFFSTAMSEMFHKAWADMEKFN